jgi:hypothetical protein
VDPLDALRAQRDLQGAITAWAPGYSSDGKIAVVVINFPWSPRAGNATYVMERAGDGWKILSRKFLYYL